MTTPSPARPEPVLPLVARGDQAAVRECLRRYGRWVFALARRFLGNPTDAEDAVQEIFIELWKSAGRFDPASGSEPTFITMIARRRLIDGRRRSARRPAPAPLPEAVPDRQSTSSFDSLDEVVKARCALAELRDDERTVIRLAVEQGLTHPEIAARTGFPVGTVKTHIRRGLMKVRQRLDANAGDRR
jgi:RNA polymerase sigma-70 factor (ECF subfamily)